MAAGSSVTWVAPVVDDGEAKAIEVALAVPAVGGAAAVILLIVMVY